VDRRIIVKLLVTFYERGQSGDVMRLMASMLDFTPDDKRKVRGSENATKGHGRTKPARGGGCSDAQVANRFWGFRVWENRNTRPLRNVRRLPSTRWYPVLTRTRSPRVYGICPSFKGHSLSPPCQT
jgi:hypothetical protein